MIVKAIISHLLSVGDVTSLVGTRIRPTKLNRKDSLPAVRVFMPSSQSVHHMGGHAGRASSRIQVDCYAATYGGSQDLAEAVRLALDTFRGTVGGEVISHVTQENSIDGYEDPIDASDRGKFKVTKDFRVWWVEAIPS